MEWIKEKIKYLKSDISRVLIASGVNKGISMILSIVIVRILSKEDYGLFSFAYNKVSIIMVFRLRNYQRYLTILFRINQQ